jgi:hypothetical protein
MVLEYKKTWRKWNKVVDPDKKSRQPQLFDFQKRSPKYVLEKRWCLEQMVVRTLDMYSHKTESVSQSVNLQQCQFEVNERPYYKAWNSEIMPGKIENTLDNFMIRIPIAQ